jgi:hypothetical protein
MRVSSHPLAARMRRDAMRCDRAHWRKTQKPSRAIAQSDREKYRRGTGGSTYSSSLSASLSSGSSTSSSGSSSSCFLLRALLRVPVIVKLGLWVYGFTDGSAKIAWRVCVCVRCQVRSEESGKGEGRGKESERRGTQREKKAKPGLLGGTLTGGRSRGLGMMRAAHANTSDLPVTSRLTSPYLTSFSSLSHSLSAVWSLSSDLRHSKRRRTDHRIGGLGDFTGAETLFLRPQTVLHIEMSQGFHS